MKVKALLVGLVALLSVSSAVAAPPPGKGKPQTTGDNCKPKVSVVLRGTFVSATSTTFDMKVVGANRWGRAWKVLGTAHVTLTPDTKVRGNGMKTLADLAKLTDGDRVLVQARNCKSDFKEGAALPTLTAVRVVGHPAHSQSD